MSDDPGKGYWVFYRYVSLAELTGMEAEIGQIDGFRFVQSPLAQEPEEPKAKNGAKASKKTERAKAKLAFYQGKRRF